MEYIVSRVKILVSKITKERIWVERIWVAISESWLATHLQRLGDPLLVNCVKMILILPFHQNAEGLGIN